MTSARHTRLSIPTGRKLLYATLILVAFLALVEGLPRLFFGRAGPVSSVMSVDRCWIEARGLVCDSDSPQRDQGVAVPLHGPRPRVLVFGGSTVRNPFSHDPEADFPLQLQRLLPELEIVNLGVPGYTTREVRVLVAQSAALVPDLILVYTGHNDYSRAFFEGRLPGTPTVRTQIERSLDGSWIRAGVEAVAKPSELGPGGNDLLAMSPGMGTRERDAALASLRSELDALLAVAPAPVMLATLLRNPEVPPSGEDVSNHPDCPPLLLDWRHRAQDLARWTREVEGSCGEGALLWWLRARQSGDPLRRRVAFARSMDLDAAPVRAPYAADQAIRELAVARGVALVDLAALRDGLPPGSWFFDAIHTQPAGARAMAEQLAPAIRARLR